MCCQRLKFWQSGKISTNLVTLVDPLPKDCDLLKKIEQPIMLRKKLNSQSCCVKSAQHKIFLKYLKDLTLETKC